MATASRYRLRLVLGFTLVIGLLAGAWAWSLYAPLDDAIGEQQRAHLTDLARAAAAIVETGGDAYEGALSTLGGQSGVRLTVVASDGTVLTDTQEEAASLGNHGDRPEIRAALRGETGTDVRRSATQGVDRMYVAVPAVSAGGEPLAVRASESLDQIATLSSRARRAGLLLLPAVLLLAALAAWRITRAAAGPVERLAAAAHSIASGDLAAPVPDEVPALRPLSSALVTLREQLEQRLSALEAERRTLRVALDGLSDGILLLENGRVQLANRALSTMFRLVPGDLVGRGLGEVGLPASLEAAVDSHVEQEPAASVELGPDPFQRYHRVLVIPLGEDGARRVLVVIADVTDRMRLEAVRRDFVANASHELKTPTASIVLLSESASEAAADGDEAQALSFVAQIREESLRLKRIVTDLLDLSRLENVPDTQEIADVRHSVDLALAGHRRSAAEKGLQLSADLESVSGLDVAARIPAADLAVALDNVLSNAIAYTEVGEVIVKVSVDESSVVVEVVDTGIGIPDSDVERVFERFYRVDRARSRTSGGTGLGLSLVRNAVERAGGTATIESGPDGGTTVRLRLPRAR